MYIQKLDITQQIKQLSERNTLVNDYFETFIELIEDWGDRSKNDLAAFQSINSKIHRNFLKICRELNKPKNRDSKEKILNLFFNIYLTAKPIDLNQLIPKNNLNANNRFRFPKKVFIPNNPDNSTNNPNNITYNHRHNIDRNKHFNFFRNSQEASYSGSQQTLFQTSDDILFSNHEEDLVNISSGLELKFSEPEQNYQLSGSDESYEPFSIYNKKIYDNITNSFSKKRINKLIFGLNTHEHIIMRLFLVMNAYASEWIPLFLELADKTLKHQKSNQESLHLFIEPKAPSIFKNPVSHRILEFLIKSGNSFFEAIELISKIENSNDILSIKFNDQNEKKDQLEQNEQKINEEKNNLYFLLWSFLTSPEGEKFFPKWFKILKPITKRQIVEDLLAPLQKFK